MNDKVTAIFVTGGVLSSLGKGITASSIALLLERMGQKVALLKLEPYINIDPGTMSPFQHGEVYVTEDGAETDLDLGHYFRFTKSPLSRLSNVTTGQIYAEVLRRERQGDFLGKTVQVIPHITDEIKRRIKACSEQVGPNGIVVAEVGGTVGDIESLPFLEAIRQIRFEQPEKTFNVHVTYVPYIKAAGEIKTKPTQHSVQALRQIGIFPDILICRSENPLSREVKEKISSFCTVPLEAVFEAPDVDSIYEIPLRLHQEGLHHVLGKKLGLPSTNIDLQDWEKYVQKERSRAHEVVIGVVGKYVQHQDAYKSLYEALKHASVALGVRLNLVKLDSEDFDTPEKPLDGYLIPGGFGERGFEGKVRAAQYCRENKIPYFGICLGMQVLAVEFARNVLHLKDANSTEMNPVTPHPVINLMSSQVDIKELGGTMRLGNYSCDILKGSKAYLAYKQEKILERHRHRYEFNNSYKKQYEAAGVIFSGIHTPLNLVEVMEIKEHPWMVGIQSHPEFLSRPIAPHPLFIEFIRAASQNKFKSEPSMER